MSPPNRRDVLRGGALLSALALTGCGNSRVAGTSNELLGLEPIAGQPFRHGVASGDPLANAAILWTRVTVHAASQPVQWAVFADEALTVPVTGGEALATAATDYTVKVDATGLAPATTYYFHFTADGVDSPTGRFKTLPVGATERVRLGVATCGDYSRGLWNAYARLAEADVDAVLHLGDYIYETDRNAVRAHQPAVDVVSVDEYRARYSSYRLEPDLQSVHAAHAMIWVWDDHETVDGTWREGADPNDHDPAIHGPITIRQANALQAALEWLPIRLPDPTNPERIYRRFQFGNLVDIFMLDTRRIGRDEVLEGNVEGDFFRQEGAFADPARQILGAEQEGWLIDGLANSSTRWRVLGNQVVMAPLKIVGAPDASGQSVYANPDQWDGYAPARDRLFDAIEANNVNNLVVLTGDVHASLVFEVARDTNNPAAYDPATGRGVLAAEFVAPSISSAGDPNLTPGSTGDISDLLLAFGGDALRAVNPHGKYYQGTRNGYLVVDITPSETAVEFWTVPTALEITNEQAMDARFVVADGDPRITQT